MRTTRLAASAALFLIASAPGLPALAADDPTPSTTESIGTQPSATADPAPEPTKVDETGPEPSTSTSKPEPEPSTSTTPSGRALRVAVSAPDKQLVNSAGDVVTWQVTVKNYSQNALENAKVKLVYDASAIEIGADGATWDQQGWVREGDVWTLPSMAAGSEHVLTIKAKALRVEDNYGLNLAALTSARGVDEAGGDKQNNETLDADTDGYAFGQVMPTLPRLFVDAKTSTSTVRKAGDEMTWKVSLLNSGSSPATDVVASFSTQGAVDPATMKVEIPDGAGSFDAATRVWKIAEMKPGTPVVATVTAKIGASPDLSTPPMLSVRATSAEVAAKGSCTPNIDLAGDDDSCDSEGVEADTSNLAVDSQLAPGQVLHGEGDVATWTITVRNTGKSVSHDVRVKDIPGAHLLADSLAWGSVEQGLTDGAVWKVGDLAPGASATARVSIGLDKTADAQHRPVNKVVATSATQGETPTTCEGDQRCDTDSPELTPKPAANLKIDLHPKKGQEVHTRSDRLVWVATVTNTGNADAKKVVVTNKPSKGLDPTSVKWGRASIKGATNDNAAGTLSIPVLAAGKSLTSEISMTPSQKADLTKALTTRATVTAQGLNSTGTCEPNGEEDDTDRCDIASIETAKVVLKVDKTLVKPTSALRPGSPVSWVITVANSGTSTAKSVVVTSLAGEGLAKGSQTFVGKVPTGKVDNKNGTWTIPEMAPGQKLTATVRATVQPGKTTPQRLVSFVDVVSPTAPLKNPGECISNTGVDADTDQCAYDAVTVKTIVDTTTVPGDTSGKGLAVAGTTGATDTPGKGQPIAEPGNPVVVPAGEPAPVLSNPAAQLVGALMTAAGMALTVLRLRRRSL